MVACPSFVKYVFTYRLKEGSSHRDGPLWINRTPFKRFGPCDPNVLSVNAIQCL